MAFNILELMHLILFSIMQVEPVWGDLSGGFDQITDLADVVAHVRANINKKSKLRHAIARDNATDSEFKVINGAKADRVLQTVNITPRANFRFEFPDLLRHILSTGSLNYVTLSVSIKPSLSLALVKLGHGDLLASDGRCE
ncbi:hypothetical protein BGW80DRAFT_1463326 [Lactifluus volemus]|nr:hypothetical protein BGW80DRAFT_1463326 [Lactifluus volemus]